jgi:hypothetical protein
MAEIKVAAAVGFSAGACCSVRWEKEGTRGTRSSSRRHVWRWEAR